MNELQPTVKTNLIEANEMLKKFFSGKSELTIRELAEQTGKKIWFIAEILGIELD